MTAYVINDWAVPNRHPFAGFASLRDFHKSYRAGLTHVGQRGYKIIISVVIGLIPDRMVQSHAPPFQWRLTTQASFGGSTATSPKPKRQCLTGLNECSCSPTMVQFPMLAKGRFGQTTTSTY